MAANPENLKLGTQILYIPNHADGNIEHFDVEAGFVVSVTEDGAFCRYWRRLGHWRWWQTKQLRTRMNSELTPFGNLLIYESAGKSAVDKAIKAYVE